MGVLGWIIVFSLLAGVLSVLVVSVFLLTSERTRASLLPHLVSFAIGSLLGAALLGLLPHAFSGRTSADPHSIFLTLLLGLLGFFLLEKLVLWRHCHYDECEAHAPHSDPNAHRHKPQAAGYLVLIGDSVHNFVDGILIGAAFLTDIHLGVVTAMAIAAHEIPQELGDFIVLLHSGFSRSKALLYNVLSSFTTIFGGILAYFSLSGLEKILPYVLAVAASSFIYVAVADLIPGLHKRVEFTQTLQQLILISGGVLLIYATHSSLH